MDLQPMLPYYSSYSPLSQLSQLFQPYSKFIPLILHLFYSNSRVIPRGFESPLCEIDTVRFFTIAGIPKLLLLPQTLQILKSLTNLQPLHATAIQEVFCLHVVSPSICIANMSFLAALSLFSHLCHFFHHLAILSLCFDHAFHFSYLTAFVWFSYKPQRATHCHSHGDDQIETNQLMRGSKQIISRHQAR